MAIQGLGYLTSHLNTNVSYKHFNTVFHFVFPFYRPLKNILGFLDWMLSYLSVSKQLLSSVQVSQCQTLTLLSALKSASGSDWVTVLVSRGSEGPLCGICCSQALWGAQSLQHYGMQSQKSPKLGSFAQGYWAQDSIWEGLWPNHVPILHRTAGRHWLKFLSE